MVMNELVMLNRDDAMAFLSPNKLSFDINTFSPSPLLLTHSPPMFLSLTFLRLALLGPASAIFGPISTAHPNPAGGNVANTGPPNTFFQGHGAPFPTDDWWVGYAAGSTGDDGS